MLNEFKYGSPILQAIMNQQSHHHFSKQAIGKSSIQILLDAGIRTSTNAGDGLWSYVVIQEDGYIKYLREYASLLEGMDSSYSNLDVRSRMKAASSIQVGSGSLILICANLLLPFSLDNCWLAVENMLLTASALGFGVSMDGSLLKVLNLGNIKSDLNVPDELMVLAAIVVGEPEKSLLPSNADSPKVWKWV
jgi:nitroreductase